MRLSLDSVVRKARRRINQMDPDTQRALGAIAGYLAGEIANQAYERQTPDGKEKWDKSRIVHHGDAGYFIKQYKKNDPLLQGLGDGLMVSDLNDIDKCIYPVLEKAKKAKKRKR